LRIYKRKGKKGKRTYYIAKLRKEEAKIFLKYSDRWEICGHLAVPEDILPETKAIITLHAKREVSQE